MASYEDDGDAYLPLRALSLYSGLSVRTLRGYLVRLSSPLPYYRVGGKILVKRSEFDAWMAAFRAAEPARLDALVADVLKGL
jgi:excisionase family DNA binding protein